MRFTGFENTIWVIFDVMVFADSITELGNPATPASMRP